MVGKRMVGGGGVGGRTTQRRWFIFLVSARFSSRSFGGSTRSAQFSSTESSLSCPLFVTHGCS